MEKDLLIIKNGCVLTPFQVFEEGIVVIKGRHIEYVGPAQEAPMGQEPRVVDAEGGYISPGFIDVHLHGGGGADTMDGTREALFTIARAHTRGGTTAMLPTTLTQPMEDIERAIACVQEVMDRSTGGADILGVHVEGPYFSMEQKGAQNPDYLQLPKPNEYLPLLDRYSCIRRVSVAPELHGALRLGRELQRRGIIASIAHTNATYQEIVGSLEWGYTHVTHMFSGMSSLHRVSGYRVAGVIEATLLLDELTTEVIADGHHLPPSLLKLIIKTKGSERVSLVTDAMAAAGLGSGEYTLGGLDVIVEDDIPSEFEIKGGQGNYVAKLTNRTAFAGSVATMNQLVRTMVQLVGLPLQEAVKMATINPARLLNIDSERGILAPGMRGDVVVFNHNIDVKKTIVGGNVVFES